MAKQEIKNPFLKELLDNNQYDPTLLELPMSEFLEVVQDHLTDCLPAKENHWDLDEYPLLPGQALYVMNYPETSISYQRGMEDLLGYKTHEITMEILVNYFHPDQYKILQRLVKGAVNFGITQDQKQEKDTWMLLTFKGRKKDGGYIPLLRQTSIYERDTKGRMISSFSILSDLTGMNKAEKVEWKLKGPQVDEDRFRRYIYKAHENFFSVREVTLLHHLEDGESSQQIAEKLFISKNTVDTHRRNMLKKASCSNTTELVNFARKNGII